MAEKRSRGPASNSPKSAASLIRRSAQTILKSGARLSNFKAEKTSLISWAKAQNLILPFSYIEQFSYIGDGAEHRVYKSDREPDNLAIKTTHCNRFGHSTREEGAIATPVEYLLRLAWQNFLFGDQIEIVGVCCDDESQVEIVTSQPWINANELRPNPTTQEIDEYMGRFRFFPALPELEVPIYYSRVFGLVIGDANDRNVIRDFNGDLTAIDVVIGAPGKKLLGRILENLPKLTGD